VWIAFSAAATAMQVALEHAALLAPTMRSASRALDATLLIAAGAFQWMPAKAACLERCRSPMELMLTRWHAGRLGAFRMGAEHGLYCLGCCWALMLLLFVAGVMNLAWVALITLFVLAEKLTPAAWRVSRIAGVAMVAAGIVVAIA
jgi:predicted metal-binding membrane protein